jgi:uncharacterized protein DUF3300
MMGRTARLLAGLLMLYVTWPATVHAQTPEPAQESSTYNTEQLDALLAPIALYPDALLTQILMAATFPLQVVEAARWADQPANKALSGDALTKALEAQPWDPSVKSLLPFPQVLAQMNEHLDWMQQLGYAFADQQAAVMDSVQRLRLQAQESGHLQSSPQQVVRTEQQSIVIEPAQENVVYVPSYNPTVVYGAWPYPAYPPVYLPPPVAYPVGTALATGLAFGVGVAVTAGLWNWARPVWGYGGGYVNVNVNRYNNINVNRGTINSNRWQANRPGGRPAGFQRPPGGPVGAAGRPGGLPAGAIGRPQVSVPGNAVRPPARPGGGQGGIAANRPGLGQGGAGANRPGGARPATPPNLANRPNAGQRPNINNPSINRPAGNRPAGQPNRPTNLPSRQQGQGAFSGMNNGRQARDFGQRGGQSRSFNQVQRPAGGGNRAGGGGGRAGGGRAGGGRAGGRR